MILNTPWRRLAGTCFVLAALGPALRAQNALYVQDDGKGHLVRRVAAHMPYYENESGKFVAVPQPRYLLQPAAEYAPVYVSLRNVKVGTEGIAVVQTGEEMNHGFEFRAEFESAFALEHVFVVLDLNTEDAGKVLFIREVGNLKPREPKALALRVPMSQGLGEGRYRIHVFSDGVEVFHSRMPLDYVERTLDKMVQRRLAGVKDALPKPFVGPAPEYPEKLRRAKTGGQAVIHFTISPNGRVIDPTIKTATDPALGEAALAAARLWRFLPKVKAGIPVPTAADLPFNFGATAEQAVTR